MPGRARPGARRRALVALAGACAVLVLVGTSLVALRARPDETVLTVDGWSLTRPELRAELDQIAANPGYRAARARNGQPLAVFREGSTTEYDPALVVELLNERITFRLAAAEVARRGLVATDADRAAALAVVADGLDPGTAAPGSTVPAGADGGRAVLDAFGSYRDVLVAGVVDLQLLQRALGLGTGVSEDDAAKVLFERTKDQIALQSCVRHLLVRAGPPPAPGAQPQAPGESDYAVALERARDLRARVAAGEDLAALATSSSDDPSSRTRGGDLGCVPRGRYDGDFEKAAWDQPVGEVGPPVRSAYGWHLVQVYERRPRTYDELLPALRQAVRDEAQAGLQSWLKEASKKAAVAVDPGVGRWNATTGLVELPGAATMGLSPQGSTPPPPTTAAPAVPVPGGTR